MALKYLSNIDLNGNSVEKSYINNSVIHPRSSVPVAGDGIGGSLQLGQIYYNTTEKKLYTYNTTGSVWDQVGTTYALDVAAGTTNIVLQGNDGSAAQNVAISGGTNINTVATTDTITVNLDNTISLSGDISAVNATLTGYLRGPASFVIDPATHGNDTGTVVIAGNLQVDGTTTTVNSTTVTIDDPIFTLGGDGNGIDDSKDRGIEFKWHNGSATKVGFFGFDDSSGKFTFIPDATNSSEVFSGTAGTLVANLEGNVTGNITGEVSTLSNHFHKVALADSESSVSKTGNTYTITHNLGTRDVLVQVTRVGTPYDTVYVDVERLLTSTVKISFGAAVTDGDYKVLVFRLA
tara:strand:- start:130 stop:1176 length:1047 start_codon:yes stop_codon:yes gene_type:complete